LLLKHTKRLFLLTPFSRADRRQNLHIYIFIRTYSSRRVNPSSSSSSSPPPPRVRGRDLRLDRHARIRDRIISNFVVLNRRGRARGRVYFRSSKRADDSRVKLFTNGKYEINPITKPRGDVVEAYLNVAPRSFYATLICWFGLRSNVLNDELSVSASDFN